MPVFFRRYIISSNYSIALMTALLLLISVKMIANDNISLPDIVITGEIEQLKDTISLEERLRKYWVINDLNKFAYEPFINPDEIPDYFEQRKEKNGALTFSDGRRFDSHLNVVYVKPSKPLLSFLTSYDRSSVVENRYSRKLLVGWYPRYENTDFGAELKHFSFKDKRDSLVSNKLSVTSFNLHSSSDDLSFKGISFEDAKLRVGFAQAEQKNLFDNESFDFNLDLGFKFPYQKHGIYFPFETHLVKKNCFSTVFGVARDDFIFFDQLGFKVLTDYLTIYPTVDFHTELSITDFLRLKLQNRGEVSTQRREDYLIENPDQDLIVTKRITTTPLNASMTIENDRIIPISFAYNLRWDNNYLYYDVNSDGLFRHSATDLLAQRFSLKFGYNYHNYFLYNSSELIVLEKEIPFTPEFVNRFVFGWENNKTVIETELIAPLMRQNSNQKDMMEIVLLNLHASRIIGYNLSVFSTLSNILNQKYRKYEYSNLSSLPEIPYERFYFDIGLRWQF